MTPSQLCSQGSELDSGIDPELGFFNTLDVVADEQIFVLASDICFQGGDFDHHRLIQIVTAGDLLLAVMSDELLDLVEGITEDTRTHQGLFDDDPFFRLDRSREDEEGEHYCYQFPHDNLLWFCGFPTI